jgi:hypothetical protein
MTAADHMPVRTREGVRSMPRRAALGLIAAGRAKPVKAPEAPAPAGVSQDIITERIAGALGVPPEALTPTSDDAHWAHGDQGPELAKRLDAHWPGRESLAEWFEEQAASMPADIEPPLSEPRGNASRVVWADYAESLGVTVTDDMTRNVIRDAAREAATSTVRLPQPAREGGRLDTPEDEPVTESAVTDGENPGSQ